MTKVPIPTAAFTFRIALLLFSLLPSSFLLSAQLGYYPSWAAELPPEKIDFRQFTHLVHAFVTLEGGTVHVSGNLPSAALTRKAHAENVRVLLGVGGEASGPGFSAMTRDPKRLQECVKNLVQLVTANGYDGIDVDWEYPGKADSEAVVQFVWQLRLALNQASPQALLLTMALPPDDSYGNGFDGRQLAAAVDFAQIMTYDLHGPWKDGAGFSPSGYNSPLDEFSKAVDYWCAKGFPKEKLLVGIPCYGHGFALKEWGKTPTQAPVHPEIAYKEIPSLLQQGWVRHWAAKASVPWIESSPGQPTEIISYDDSESAALKGRWARNAGVGGIFFWDITQDLIDGRNVLVQAARSGWNPSEAR